MAKEKTKKRAAIPLISDGMCIELSGNREAVLEGSRGVLEYSPDCIRVNTADLIVTFSGRGLDLRCISESALIIGGYITAIEFTA